MHSQNKIRVLFTIPNFDTAGSGKALLNIAKGLDPKQFEAHIACLHDRGAFFQVVKESGIPIHVFPFVSPARPIKSLLHSSWKASRQFKRIQPDIIHSFHYSADYTEPLAAKMAGIPWVFTKKNMSWGGPSKNAWKLRSFLANGIAIQNTDMKKMFYPTSNKTMLIPRGVNTEMFAPQMPKPEIRLQMQTGNEKRIIICVANMVPVKGIELLIEAWEGLVSEFQDWVIWLVGDDQNEYSQSLKNLVKEKELESFIRFAGKQQNVRAYLDHAEIFVLPTKNEGRREGSPVALLEAMANGKVVIGSAVPGISDQLSSWSEYLFEPGSYTSLKEKLLQFISNSIDENNVLGCELQEYANIKYLLKREINLHQQLYKTTLRKYS